MRLRLMALVCLLPWAGAAADQQQYGLGILCPHSDSQVIFYTENNQQDAAGTIAFQPGQGFTLTSTSVRDLPSAGAYVMEGTCESGAPGIRIDAKRDGWLQAGTLWLPPNQEWDYGDWVDYLRKASIWKPLVPIVLYQGNMEGPYKEKPYMGDPMQGRLEIYPIKVLDDFALVVIDTEDTFTKSCAGQPLPPIGRLGWMRLVADDGKPIAVPAHPKGCGAP